jgi:hypothetical protein
VFANLKFGSAVAVLISLAVGPMTNSASAVTAEVAKKCAALTAKAYPPRETGNPAAGSAKGTGSDMQNYFRRCVTNGGSMDDDAPKERKSAEVGLCSLVAKPANFDLQPVTLQGKATAQEEKTSNQGNNYTLFKLQDPGGCGAVNIFTWGHPKLSNGDDVRVEGVFETIHHQDRSIFYNQVEATKVIPLPR